MVEYIWIFLEVSFADFIVQDSSLEADGYSVHAPPFMDYNVHKIPPLDSVLSQMNLVRILMLHFSKTLILSFDE
jgi:hypothetical protein